MTDSISHRGPDSDGFYNDKEVSLGMRRLKIIDLKTGDQPIFNKERTMCIFYNGEVYNFKELKEDLISKGHKFYTDTDTEVILHSYEEYGKDCVKLLRGMFAFAIWDIKNKILFIARDRLGIKPLYYTFYDGKFIFSSEIKSLLQNNEVKRELNKESFYHYLTFRYIPGNRTLFKGIFKLPPGHSLTLHKNNLDIKKYWDLTIGNIENKSEKYFSNKVLELIRESIKIRLVSDVPYGAYLSGGLDSSGLVAIMQSFLKDPVKTFSVGFDAPEPFNELRHARLVSNKFGTDHHEVVVKPEDIELLPKVIWHLDDAVANPLILISQYKLSELAKKKVSMVLVGEGADELFSGYAEFKIHSLSRRFRFIPKFIRRGLISPGIRYAPQILLNKSFKYSAYFGDAVRERLKDFTYNLDNNEETYLLLREFFSKKEKKDILSEEIYEKEKNTDYLENFRPYFSNIEKNFLDSLIMMDLKGRLPDFLLHEVDKMTMAHGLEARVPFIDHKLAEFSFTIPPNFKLKGTNVKYILKKSFSKILPEEILKRKKHPFTNPVHGEYAKSLLDLASKTLSSSEIIGKFIRKNSVEKMVQKYNRAPMYYYRQLSSVVTFDLWHKIYIENDNFKNPQLNLDKIFG